MPQTIVSVLETHLDAVRDQIKPSTHDVYHRYLTDHISPYFKGLLCEQLDLERTQGFVDKKLESGLSALTVQSVLYFLKSGLKGAGLPAFDPKIPKHASKEIEVLTHEEQDRLEAAAMASDGITRVGVILCMYTGIRLGELCGLKTSDLEAGVLHIRRTVQRIRDMANAKTQLVFLPPKNASSLRSIPLPNFLLEMLKEHARHGEEYLLDGKVLEPRNMQRRFKRLLVTAGVRPVTFQALRHTFAVRALEKGFDAMSLSEILGHCSPVGVYRKYACGLDDRKVRSMEMLAGR